MLHDDGKRCDWEQIIREVEAAIANQCERITRSVPEALRGDPDDEIARYRALVMYHADMLGYQLVELAQWLERGTAKHPVSQRRARGRERIPKIPRP